MQTPSDKTKAFKLTIDGMSCQHCIQAVMRALSGVSGLKVCAVSIGSAVIESAEVSGVMRAIDALREEGFEAKPAGIRESQTNPQGAKE